MLKTFALDKWVAGWTGWGPKGQNSRVGSEQDDGTFLCEVIEDGEVIETKTVGSKYEAEMFIVNIKLPWVDAWDRFDPGI